MKLSIVGADFEENLGVGLIAAAALRAGYEAEVVGWNEGSRGEEVAAKVLAGSPDVVGLSIQFQHRAPEFLALAARLRALGFAGHITCGGHFPTLAFREVLAQNPAIDTIVLHEGEHTIVDLLAALAATPEGRPPLDAIAGLALRDADPQALPRRTGGRPLSSLDELPFPARYRAPSRHLGVPYIPVLGSRGCWGSCAYCSITSFYRDARRSGGGHTLRLRSPENVAAEMALLWHRVGVPSIFCFHDENLLLPRPADSLARLEAIRRSLDEYGVGRVGLVGKCRPDTLTPELARELARLGVIRLYVGVENAAESGARHLGRRTQTRHVHDALAACREAGIFVCYNLLIFEPEATLDDVEANVAFIREHAAHPVNFCRAEAYYGTPLHYALAESQPLGGSYLGWNYRIADDRTELLFRIASAAFRQRNFDPDGVANRSMGLGYLVKLLEHFHPGVPFGVRTALARRADELTSGITRETAAFLDEALHFARTVELGDRDRVERETGLLGLRIAAADRHWHRELDEIERAMSLAAAPPVARAPVRPPRAFRELTQRMALGASIVASAVTTTACQTTTVVDPVPNWDMRVVDPVPADMRAPLDLDPLPPDLGADFGHPDAGDLGDLGPPRPDLPLADPVPFDLGGPGPVDPLPPDLALLEAPHTGRHRLPLVPLVDDGRHTAQWRQTAPERTLRSNDLPLAAPPSVSLRAHRDGEAIFVELRGGPGALGTRWEGDGRIDSSDETALTTARRVRWQPTSPEDQLRVGVRTRNGVAILALRARSV